MRRQRLMRATRPIRLQWHWHVSDCWYVRTDGTSAHVTGRPVSQFAPGTLPQRWIALACITFGWVAGKLKTACFSLRICEDFGSVRGRSGDSVTQVRRCACAPSGLFHGELPFRGEMETRVPARSPSPSTLRVLTSPARSAGEVVRRRGRCRVPSGASGSCPRSAAASRPARHGWRGQHGRKPARGR